MTRAAELVALLTARQMTCATAESCTGGGIGAALTSVRGASTVYKGGVISYANEVKENLLGVSAAILAEKGAVSPETAAAMAEGVRRLLKVDFAFSVTGIAGPGGGTPTKPVGLVWFGVASERGTFTEKRNFLGDRAAIRAQAAECAVELLINQVKEIKA